MKIEKYILLFAFFWGIHLTSFSQNRNYADSLINLLSKQKPPSSKEDTLRYYLLSNISFYHTNPDSVLLFSKQLIKESESFPDKRWLYSGYFNEGNAYRLMGDLNKASHSFFKSLQIAEEINSQEKKAFSFLAIADVYAIQGAHDNSVEFYTNSIQILSRLNNDINLGTAYLNLGEEYLSVHKLDSALKYINEAEGCFKKSSYLTGEAYSLGSLGTVYAKMGERKRGEALINQSVDLLLKTEDYYPISVNFGNLSDIYFENNELDSALSYALKSFEMADKYKLKEQIRDGGLRLSIILEETGDFKKSLEYYKIYSGYKDSVNNNKAYQELADLRIEYVVNQKLAQIELLEKESQIIQLISKRQKLVIFSSLGLLFFAAFYSFFFFKKYKVEKKLKTEIELGKKKSDKLLLNILPEVTAIELKEFGKVKSRKFEFVTVMFSDFEDFTKLAENESPEKIVESIDFYFKKFDEITSNYGLEKIKTIGDSYMCAGGLPQPNSTHVANVAMAAKEMMDFVHNSKLEDLEKFEMRIGIHSGPVVAGIVGNKKWQYDIWGDTVNIASRLETNSEPGKINVSETFVNSLPESFHYTYRGKFEVKNHRALNMYFLE